MWSTDLSIQQKQTIVISTISKSIREIAGTFGVAKSTVWYILRMHCWAQNIKRLGCPQRTTVADDRRILSMVKKAHFTTSSQEKNTLQEADVSLSKSTIKRRLQRVEVHKVQTKPDFAKTHLQKQDHFWKSILCMAETKINLYQNDGKKKVWRRFETAYDAKHTTSYVKHGGAVWCMSVASSGIGYWCLLMTWQKTLILNCTGIYSLPRFSQMQQSWLDGTS